MDKESAVRLEQPGPWFRWHPALAVALAITLYAGVFTLRLAVDGTTEAITLLYVLPIALLATAFGLRAGVLAGTGAVVLLGAWVLADGVTLTPLGWLARVVPMLLWGVLLGYASDRIRAAAEAERKVMAAALREREAAEINDSVIQRLSAAKWSLEAGDHERSMELLIDSIETAQGLVADLLRNRPLRGGPPQEASFQHGVIADSCDAPAVEDAGVTALCRLSRR
jgi:signal transduction histidine kinase